MEQAIFKSALILDAGATGSGFIYYATTLASVRGYFKRTEVAIFSASALGQTTGLPCLLHSSLKSFT